MNPEFVRFVDIPDADIRKQIFLDYFHGWEESLFAEADLGMIDIPEWVKLPREEKVEELLKVIEEQFVSASTIDPNSHWTLLGYDNGSRFAFGSMRLNMERVSDGKCSGNWYDLSNNGYGREEMNGNVMVGYAVQTTRDPQRRVKRGFTIIIESIGDYARRQGIGLRTLSPLGGLRKYEEKFGPIEVDEYVDKIIQPEKENLILEVPDALRIHINKGAILLKDPVTGKYLIWKGYKEHPPSKRIGASTEYLPPLGSMC